MPRKRRPWIKAAPPLAWCERQRVWAGHKRSTITREEIVLDLWNIADMLKEEGLADATMVVITKENVSQVKPLFTVLAPFE